MSPSSEGLPWAECGYEEVPGSCEVCGEGKPIAICIGVETLAYCQGCIDEAEVAWTNERETGDIRQVFR